jgi:hypothetical protein
MFEAIGIVALVCLAWLLVATLLGVFVGKFIRAGRGPNRGG